MFFCKTPFAEGVENLSFLLVSPVTRYLVERFLCCLSLVMDSGSVERLIVARTERGNEYIPGIRMTALPVG